MSDTMSDTMSDEMRDEVDPALMKHIYDKLLEYDKQYADNPELFNADNWLATLSPEVLEVVDRILEKANRGPEALIRNMDPKMFQCATTKEGSGTVETD